MEFDSSIDSRAFVNDSFLAWLRTNAQRAGVPYAIVSIPGPAEISTQPIAPAKPKEAPKTPFGGPQAPARQPATPPPTGDRDQSSDPATDVPTIDPTGRRNPAPPPSAPRQPLPGSQPQRGSTQKADQDLDKLAPIPASALAPPETEATYRYTVTWIAQIRPVAEMEKESSGDPKGAEEAPQ
jgi:hypothetical protein